jgi:hypothetical protein
LVGPVSEQPREVNAARELLPETVEIGEIRGRRQDQEQEVDDRSRKAEKSNHFSFFISHFSFGHFGKPRSLLTLKRSSRQNFLQILTTERFHNQMLHNAND